MIRLISLLICCSIFLSSASTAFAQDASGSADTDEALILNLDQSWKLANKRQSGNEHVLQYLPTGADQKNPAEMITVTTVSGISPEKDAKTYLIQVRNAMENAKESGAFKWKLVKDSPDDASCEYTLAGHPKIPNQHEMMRVLRGSGEIHSIIYHFGKETITESEKEKAWNIVNAVKLSASATP